MKKKMEVGVQQNIQLLQGFAFLLIIAIYNPKCCLPKKKTDTHRLLNQGDLQVIVNVAAFNCKKALFQEKFSTNQILTGTIGICRRQEVKSR